MELGEFSSPALWWTNRHRCGCWGCGVGVGYYHGSNPAQMKRYSVVIAFVLLALGSGVVLAQAGPTPTPGSPCTDTYYGKSIDDDIDVTNPQYAICAEDEYSAVFGGSGYLYIILHDNLPADTDGLLTVWYSGVCTLEYWFVGETFGTDIGITGDMPYTALVLETEEIKGVFITENSSCTIDAVKIEPYTATATPTATFTATPAPTSGITPGVSSADIIGYLEIFNGWELIVALFFGCALVGAFLGLITARRNF